MPSLDPGASGPAGIAGGTPFAGMVTPLPVDAEPVVSAGGDRLLVVEVEVDTSPGPVVTGAASEPSDDPEEQLGRVSRHRLVRSARLSIGFILGGSSCGRNPLLVGDRSPSRNSELRWQPVPEI
jgi:hypothetical protein